MNPLIYKRGIAGVVYRRCKRYFSLIMYGFCNNDVLYTERLSYLHFFGILSIIEIVIILDQISAWYLLIKVLLIKKTCNLVLQWSICFQSLGIKYMIALCIWVLPGLVEENWLKKSTKASNCHTFISNNI